MYIYIVYFDCFVGGLLLSKILLFQKYMMLLQKCYFSFETFILQGKLVICFGNRICPSEILFVSNKLISCFEKIFFIWTYYFPRTLVVWFENMTSSFENMSVSKKTNHLLRLVFRSRTWKLRAAAAMEEPIAHRCWEGPVPNILIYIYIYI